MSLPHPDLHADAEGFVLSGGRSSRMGRDKTFLEVAGQPLVRRAVQILRAAGLETRVAGTQSALAEFAPVVPDQADEVGLGPLAGICAALSACRSRFALFLPVDLPLIPPSLIEYLVHHAAVTQAGATVFSVAGFVQTFPAIIDCASLQPLKECLHSGDRNCLKAFRAAATGLRGGLSVLPLEWLVQAGQVWHSQALSIGEWFLNVNTPDDLKLAEQLLAAPIP